MGSARVPRSVAPVSAGVGAAVVTALALDVPAPWRDEQATAAATSRTWPQLIDLVTGPTDAVHAVYYALLHPWVAVFGIDPLWLRLPSVIAIGFAAAGIVILGRQIDRTRTGAIAAALFVTIPRVFWAAGEARSYALQIAAAVWVTVLFVEAVRRGRWWRWALFALATAAANWVFLYLALLGVAQLVTLALVPGWRRRLLPAVGALAAAAVASAPIVLLGLAQRGQISWVRRPGPGILGEVALNQWFMGSVPYAVVAAVLASAGVVAIVVRPPERRLAPGQLVALLLPWLALPTVIVVVASVLVTPLYVERYLVMSAPALAMVAAFAVARAPTWGVVLAVSVVVAVAAPVAVGLRAPDAKDDWGRVATALENVGRPGDAIFFSSDPDGDEPRGIATFWPDAVTGFEDVAFVESAAEAGTLHDVVLPAAEALARLDDGQDLVTVLQNDSVTAAADREAFAAAGLAETVVNDTGETTVSVWR